MRVLKYGVAGAVLVGGLTYVGAKELDERLTVPSAEINEDVERCARALGELPLSRVVLPVACERFQDTFDFTETTFTDQIDGELKTETSLLFETPTGEEFLEEQLVDPQEHDQEEARKREVLGRFMGTFGGFFGFMLGAGAGRARDAKEENQD